MIGCRAGLHGRYPMDVGAVWSARIVRERTTDWDIVESIVGGMLVDRPGGMVEVQVAHRLDVPFPEDNSANEAS